jgi:predicted DNA-binding transcriptional regulator YafY
MRASIRNMANTSSRTLRLLSLLQAQRYWAGGVLADRLGVSPRTLRRDVERLRELGYPVEAHRGVDGGYQLAAGAALPPLVVDDEEAVALAIGLRAAAYGSVIGVEEASVRALAKVVQVMPPRLRRRVEALTAATEPPVFGGPETVDADVLTSVAQGCRDEERVRFDYTAHGGVGSERFVEPHRLVSYGRRWYLVAYDLDRGDWRSFRVDRIRAVRSTGARFRPRALPGGDYVAFVRAGAARGAAVGAEPVEALVYAPALAVIARIGSWATVTEVSPDVCRVRLVADGYDWPAFALAMVGAEFRILGPPGMAARARDWGERFSRATRTG